MNRLRIGLTQRVEETNHGERRDCLDQAWAKLLGELQFVPIPLANCVLDVGQYVNELQLDGVILTGGNDLESSLGGSNFAPERDRFERDLVEFCADAKRPVFGVCRGLQMLVVQSGGQLTPIENHVASPHPIELCHSSPPSYFDAMLREEVNSFHNFGVTKAGLAPCLQAIATAPDGSVEAIAHKSLRQAAVMWHPERSPSDQQDKQMIKRFFEEEAT